MKSVAVLTRIHNKINLYETKLAAVAVTPIEIPSRTR